MSADIRRIDGSAVDVSGQLQNVKVAKLLDEIGAANDLGEIKAAAVVYLTPKGSWVMGWSWPPIEEWQNFPWDLAMRGAIHALLHEIGASAVESPPPDESPAV